MWFANANKLNRKSGRSPTTVFFRDRQPIDGGDKPDVLGSFSATNSSEVKKVTGSEANVGHVQFVLRFARDRLHAAISSFHQVEEIEQKQFHNQDAAGCCEPVIPLHAGRLYPC
jgi:hypothetical protein